eukprot:760341-Hanusia_phi.AAC.5
MGRRRDATRVLQLHTASFNATAEDHLNLFFRLANENATETVQSQLQDRTLTRRLQAIRTFLIGAERAKSTERQQDLASYVELMNQNRLRGAGGSAKHTVR